MKSYLMSYLRSVFSIFRVLVYRPSGLFSIFLATLFMVTFATSVASANVNDSCSFTLKMRGQPPSKVEFKIENARAVLTENSVVRVDTYDVQQITYSGAKREDVYLETPLRTLSQLLKWNSADLANLDSAQVTFIDRQKDDGGYWIATVFDKSGKRILKGTMGAFFYGNCD